MKQTLKIATLLLLAVAGRAQDEPSRAKAPAEDGFQERQLSPPVNAVTYPGILCLPVKRDIKLPVVVMVNGSDVLSNDGSLRVQRMFSGLAHELARRGIASWRYQQPSSGQLYPITPGQLPLDLYITNAAVAALSYVARLPEVDESRVYILGHALGGTMAPYIAERHPSTAGIIFMAAEEVAIEKTLAERKKAALEKQGVPASEISEQVEAQNKIFADIRSGKTPSRRLVLGAPAAYWRDRMNRDPARKASTLGIYVLVLQGGKDAEVSEADYDRMQSVLARKKSGKAEFHWFPALNHWFTRPDTMKPGEGGSASVDDEVVRVIEHWIQLRAGLSHRK